MRENSQLLLPLSALWCP